jgi:hypothetical protein
MMPEWMIDVPDDFATEVCGHIMYPTCIRVFSHFGLCVCVCVCGSGWRCRVPRGCAAW